MLRRHWVRQISSPERHGGGHSRRNTPIDQPGGRAPTPRHENGETEKQRRQQRFDSLLQRGSRCDLERPPPIPKNQERSRPKHTSEPPVNDAAFRIVEREHLAVVPEVRRAKPMA